MNTIFRKDKLDEITYEHFEMAAYAAMTARFTARFESIGLGGYPAGEDFVLYGGYVDGHRKSMVALNNWCGYLRLLVTDQNIDTVAERAFPKQGIGIEAVRKFQNQWSAVEEKIRDYVAEHPVKEENK